jgi:hypothetical protein
VTSVEVPSFHLYRLGGSSLLLAISSSYRPRTAKARKSKSVVGSDRTWPEWCRRVLASAVLYSAAGNFVPIGINTCRLVANFLVVFWWYGWRP